MMCYTLYRSLTQVTNWVRLKFTTMNIKNMQFIGGISLAHMPF